jgi:excisionase family DNA binding protein
MDAVLAAAQTVPRETLADFLGDLERVRVTALSRLIAQVPNEHPSDELLGVAEAARRLGVSRDYLYHNHRRFPFVCRVGRNLRFSAEGVEKYIQRASVRHGG